MTLLKLTCFTLLQFIFFASEASASPIITNGEEAEPHSIPYQVALYVPYDDQGRVSFCGGSLISPTTVLTAAHCTKDESEQDVSSIDVILGAHRINDQNEEGRLRITIYNITRHPEFGRLVNDIAILRFDEPLELNEFINITRLPSRKDVNNSFENLTAVASGWGIIADESTTLSETLQKVETPIMSNEACARTYVGPVVETNICASGKDGKSACRGDSGGPLVIEETGIQVGITSYGAPSCVYGFPSVYTRITSFLDWIEQNSDVVLS